MVVSYNFNFNNKTMKKILSFIVALTLSIGIFTSCEKDSSNSLAGTAWEATETGGGVTATATITFAEDTFNYRVVDVDDGTLLGNFNGSYTFDGTTMAGTLNATDGNIVTLRGTVSGNKMSLITTSEIGATTVIFTKK